MLENHSVLRSETRRETQDEIHRETYCKSHRLSLFSLPEDALSNIFSYLIFPGEPCHLYRMKRAISFAQISPNLASAYKSSFKRITFPRTTRFYPRSFNPDFIASLVKLYADTLEYLELPQMYPAPALLAAKEFCPSLMSLSFYYSLLLEKSLFSEVLLGCPSLKSLTIQCVTVEALGQLQERNNLSQLSNLIELALYGIDVPDVKELRAVLVLYSKQLQTVSLHVKNPTQNEDLVDMLCDIRADLVVLKSLEILQNSNRRLQLGGHYTYLPAVYDVLFLLCNHESVDSRTPIDYVHITSNFGHLRLKALRILENFQPRRIKVEMPGLNCTACYEESSSPPVVSITKLGLLAMSTDFINEHRERLKLRHVNLVTDPNSYESNSFREIMLQLPSWPFNNVSSASICVPCSVTWPPRVNLDAIQVVLPLLPQLESFEISLTAIFAWKPEFLWNTMEVVKAKKPRVVVIDIYDLLPPYLAIYCPSQGPRRQYSVSRGRLLRLGEFMRLFKHMDSVKEVVMDGETYWAETSIFKMRMEKMEVAKRERGLPARMKLVQKLLQEVIEMEREFDIDMTSVIGWYESMIHGNSSEIVCSGD